MILDRYLFREIAVPFLLGLFTLTTVFLMNQLVRLSDLFVGRGVSLAALGKLLWVLMPPFLLATLPAATLLAGIVAFSRLSADSEFVALKACGLSFARLMRPVALFAALVAAGALALGITAEPWGKGKLKHVAEEALRMHTTIAVSPGAFRELFNDVLVYAEKVTERGQLINIFVSDERDPERPLLVTARTGELVAAPEGNAVGFLLTGGEIYRAGADLQRVQFAEYGITLRLKGGEDRIFSGVDELRQELTKRRKAGEPVGRILQLWLDHTKNVTFGVACLIMGLLGPALGIHSVRSGRMGGFAVGVVIILVYYLLLNLSQAMVMGERLPVTAGAWLPNGLSLAFTLYVALRAQLERPLLPALRRRTRTPAA